MNDVVLRREFLGHQATDGMATHAHGPCDAPETLARGMSALDLLPPRNPGGTPLLCVFLLGTERPLGIDCCWRLSHRDRNPATPGTQHLIQGLAGILHQVEAISNLTRSRRALPCTFGIRLRPVSHDDLDAGMGAQPGRQGLGGPAFEEIDRTMGLEIDEDGGVHLAAPEGEIIDAEDSWGWRQREDRATKQAQERIGTDGEASGASQTRSALASCRLRQIEKERTRVHRATSPREQRRTEVLGKGAT